MVSNSLLCKQSSFCVDLVLNRDTIISLFNLRDVSVAVTVCSFYLRVSLNRLVLSEIRLIFFVTGFMVLSDNLMGESAQVKRTFDTRTFASPALDRRVLVTQIRSESLELAPEASSLLLLCQINWRQQATIWVLAPAWVMTLVSTFYFFSLDLLLPKLIGWPRQSDRSPNVTDNLSLLVLELRHKPH